MLVWGMIWTGVVALIAGLVLVRTRFAAAVGAGKLLVLGPVFEAVALAMFAAEHFLDANDLKGIVPRWLHGELFWTYFVGLALLAAAVSFIAWRCVCWSGWLLAALFLIIVATVDLPNLPQQIHERFFWILTVRETCFAGGAMVLAGSVWARGRVLVVVGRTIVAVTLVFYAIEHYLFPHNVPGVPLEKIIPAWMPAPVMLTWLVGTVLLAAGVGLMIPRSRVRAAAMAGGVLVVLTVLFYVPILVTEMGTPDALEGVNYVGDTLLFAATVLLAGLELEDVRG